MTPSPNAIHQEQAGQRRGGRNQPTVEGRTPKGTDSQIGNVDGSDACRIGKGRRLTGWQESKALAICATQANPNDVSEPSPTKGSTRRSYDTPHVKRGPKTLSPDTS